MYVIVVKQHVNLSISLKVMIQILRYHIEWGVYRMFFDSLYIWNIFWKLAQFAWDINTP